MFNEKELLPIMESVLSHGKCGGIFLSFRLGRKLQKLKRKLKKNNFECFDGYSENISKWLGENFAVIEEKLRNLRSMIKGTKNLQKHKKLPWTFVVFGKYLDVRDRCDKRHILALFNEVNGFKDGLELEDGTNLQVMFECAVVERIIDVFDSSFVNPKSAQNNLTRIENLFFTLEELSNLTLEESLFENVVEKELYNDPCGIYEILSQETKSMYRRNICLMSRRKKIRQLDLVKNIVRECRESDGDKRHVGMYLCDKAVNGKTYLTLLIFLTILFTLLLCIISPFFLLSVFSVYTCVKLLLEKFFVRYFVKPFHVPRLELDRIPEGDGVMVVITTLLTGEKSDEQVFKRLEKMYFSNSGENVYFGVLSDLADSSEKEDERDEKILQNANDRIMELRKKYSDVFFLFVRERQYNESEMCYMAHERKRGAVASLVRFLCQKSDCFSHGSVKPSEDVCRNIKYVFTLDSDTNLAFDCVRKMVGIMLHPQNKPCVDEEKAVVTKGYGILQPAMNPTLSTSRNTYFSKIMCGHGGVDTYNAGGSDVNMRLFGRSIFCGKGMFDKNCFYKTLCTSVGSFRENTVLSHDAPEGARLACAYVGDITLTDSFPKEELSYYKRLHRWIRGDVQNLVFFSGEIKNEAGKRVKNYMHIYSRFFMFENLYSALLPVFSLLCIFLSLIMDRNASVLLITVTFSAYILPFVYSVMSLMKRTIWHNLRRVFYSREIHTGIWTAFMRMLFKISSLPKTALVSLDALARSIYRMGISRKHMLEWTTAAQSDAEKKDGLLGYVKKNLFCAVCGCLVFVVSTEGFLRLVSLFWLFMPLFAYRSSVQKHEIKHLKESDKEILIGYAGDIWKFFEDNVNDETNNLPCDNVAEYPELKMSVMTSPTNIGLYLLSTAVARSFGFIDTKEMERRISECVSSIEKLPKYNGLLYNWYNILNLTAMKPKFVSSVDLGNYFACLVCTKEALSEMSGEMSDAKGLISKIERLIDETDLSFLYDKTRNLFYIGFTDNEGVIEYDKNRYDMLMSEARSLSFCSVAKRLVPVEHLSHLSRRLVGGGGYMGLASWSGTAFEYFMPELFLKSHEGSLSYEALHFSYNMQKQSSVSTDEGKVFGISESCYNELDSHSNYKYYAFGVQKLAVKVFEEKKIISPYSSFLFLPMSESACISNLKRLEKLGAYGKYGFYESLDFENHSKKEKYSVVKCFMSHHLGMSICALANMVLDEKVRKWFFSDMHNNSAEELNQEKIPYDVYVKKTPLYHYGECIVREWENREHSYDKCSCAELVLENTRVYARRDRIRITHSGFMLCAPDLFDNSLRSIEISVLIGDEQLSFGKNCELLQSNGKIVLTKGFKLYGGEMFEASLALTAAKNTSEVIKARLRLRQKSGEEKKNIRCRFVFYPILEDKQNKNRCNFFEKDGIIRNTVEGNTAKFENKRRNLYLFSGIIEGSDVVVKTDGGMTVHEAETVKINGVNECQLALSVSSSEICAQMGLVRASEKGFEENAAELEKNMRKNEGGSQKEFKQRKSNVLGASVIKQNEKPQYPFFSKEKPYRLCAGKEIAFFVKEDGLGFSFCKNVNMGRITEYSSAGKSFSENVCFEKNGFDLCKNAEKFNVKCGRAVYEGMIEGAFYKLCVFPSADMPFKIFHITTNCKLPVFFSCTPSKNMSCKREIAGGAVFFKGHDGRETGFVSGYSKNDNVCADFKTGERIYSYIKGDKLNEDNVYEYVFLLGFAQSREEALRYKGLSETEFERIAQTSDAFGEKMKSDFDAIPQNIKCVLEKFFVFPDDGMCFRSLVQTHNAMACFDCLLLIYSKSDLFSSKFKQLISSKNEFDALSKFLLAIGLSEYVKKTGDVSFPDEMCGEDVIYRCVLTYLFEAAKEQGQNEIYIPIAKQALLCMSDLCDIMKDVRTAMTLKDLSCNLSKNKGGIFM